MEWIFAPAQVGYQDALDAMQARVAEISAGRAGEAVWLLEHPPLYTAGTSSNPADLVAPDRRRRQTCRRHDLIRANPGCAENNDPRAPDMLLRRIPVNDQRLEPEPIQPLKRNRYSCTHDPQYHAPQSFGIPKRTHPSRLNH